MAHISIPNEIVKAFTGRPMRVQAMNDDLELLFKPILCPAEGCEKSVTTMQAFSDHVNGEHPKQAAKLEAPASKEMVDQKVSRLIMDMLSAFNRDTPNNPLRRFQKPRDSEHASELWRRASNCDARKEVKVKDEQYQWLQQFLDRKVPQVPLSLDPKEAQLRRENGEEPQTVASYLYGLNEDNVRQALTTLPDRRRVEPDPPDPPLNSDPGIGSPLATDRTDGVAASV